MFLAEGTASAKALRQNVPGVGGGQGGWDTVCERAGGQDQARGSSWVHCKTKVKPKLLPAGGRRDGGARAEAAVSEER